MIATYRAPSGDFKVFVGGLGSIFKKVHKTGFMIVVCGDCSISYLSEDDKRKQLNAVLYNLSSTVYFPTINPVQQLIMLL